MNANPEPLDERSGDGSYAGWTTDAARFEEMYLGTVDSVLAYFQRRVFDPETAFDLTAEVYATAWRQRRRFRFTGRPVQAWLIGIAKRLRLRHADDSSKRLLATHKLSLDVPEVDDAAFDRIEQLVDSADARELLRDAIDRCSDTERELLQLRFEGQLPYADIASRTGLTEGAARVRVHRTVRRLGLSFEDR